MIGSGVYVGRWLDRARELVESNASALAERPVWLFSRDWDAIDGFADEIAGRIQRR